MGGLEFHRQRRAAILRSHPEVRRLFGPRPVTALTTAVVLALQFTFAAMLGGHPWWWAVVAAFLLGAFLAHYLHVVIHEATHNLVLRGSALNKAVGIFANLASVVPSAVGFRYYHGLHHRFLGRPGLDPDVAPAWEAALFGRRRLGKLAWIVIQPITYTVLHPLQVSRRLPLDGWLVANVVLVLAAASAVGLAFGGTAVLYLFASSYLAVGPHPTGSHILQEHISYRGRYVTASYYGPINRISLNLGLHVEHHDLPGVPGPRLRALRRLAPDYYNDLFRYRSRLETLWRFVMDPQVGLDTRVIQPR
jgi:sphingolipid delta-4 desaturase